MVLSTNFISWKNLHISFRPLSQWSIAVSQQRGCSAGYLWFLCTSAWRTFDKLSENVPKPPNLMEVHGKAWITHTKPWVHCTAFTLWRNHSGSVWKGPYGLLSAPHFHHTFYQILHNRKFSPTQSSSAGELNVRGWDSGHQPENWISLFVSFGNKIFFFLQRFCTALNIPKRGN